MKLAIIDQITNLFIQPKTRPLPVAAPQHLPTVINVTPLPPTPIQIHIQPQQTATMHLAALLLRGRQYHPLCRNGFVEAVQIGHYAYERRTEWRTCALAAAYAGAFGAESIQKSSFSYSMAIFRLSNLINLDIGKTNITGPTGRQNNIADEMIQLTDNNLWETDGIVEWLASLEVSMV